MKQQLATLPIDVMPTLNGHRSSVDACVVKWPSLGL